MTCKNTAADFWRKVEKTTTCWFFRGYLHSKGYGYFDFRGKKLKAHRFSWGLVHGEIPDGMVVDHLCKNRSCVNPDHLRLVTPRQNTLENSVGVAALNAAKKKCPKGHDYTETWRNKKLGIVRRICVSCTKAYLKYYDKHRRVDRCV